VVVAAVIVPTVREVKTVSWETIDSTIDDNPNIGGGKRIFPDWQRPNDPVNRRRVRVKAQTTMGQGQTVFFRSFDIDDPENEITFTIDPNGAAGDDNRGSPKPGTLSAASATTDSNGVATVEFTTTMQPGDNFMVAASTDSNYLNGVVVNGTGLKDAANNDLPTNNAKATPMLTVWRQLHMEVDSMGLVEGNIIFGNVTSMEANRIIGTCDPKPQCPIDRTKYLIGIDKGIEDARYENGEGIMVIGSLRYSVLETIPISDTSAIVVVSTPDEVAPTGTQFALVDDDDYNNSDIGNLDGDEDEDIAAVLDTFSLMQNSDDPTKNVYAPAYIRPVYDGAGASGNNNNQSNEIFSLNLPSIPVLLETQLASQNSENNENDAYWVAYVQLCYQGDENKDSDTNSEPALAGITSTVGPAVDLISSSAALEGAFSSGSLVYLETMRDVAVQLSNDARKRTVPHEVGHQFGIKGDNTSPMFSFGIMADGEPKFVPMHLSLLRWRVHSP
jgi:hypothetical protein